jgi:hypothetical protein
MSTLNNSKTLAPVLPAKGGLSWTIWTFGINALYAVAALSFPLVSWMFAVDVFSQFVRMLFMWNSPGAHAGLGFVVHMGVFTAYVCFCTLYRPPGFEEKKTAQPGRT